MDHRILAMLAVPAVGIIFWCGILARAAIRTAQGATCWRCGAAKVRPSLIRGVFDVICCATLLVPFRCSGCRTRFYGIGFWREHQKKLSAYLRPPFDTGVAIDSPEDMGERRLAHRSGH